MPRVSDVPIPADLSEAGRLVWCGEACRPGAVAALPNEVTVVTAFFDIGRGDWTLAAAGASPFRRTTELYLERFAHLAKLPNTMIVFTDSATGRTVLDLRRAAGLDHRTAIFAIDDLFGRPEVAAFEEAVAARLTDAFRRIVWHPDAPEYNEPKYVVVNALKSSFVCTALGLGLVPTATLAWLDFGYCRGAGRFDETAPWCFDAAGKINLFHVAPLDGASVLHAVRTGTVRFQGCHIVGAAAAWPRFNRDLGEAMASLLAVDLVDDDQTLLLMAWRCAPERHRTHPIDPADWFVVMLRDFAAADPAAVPQAAVPALTVRNELAALHAVHVRERWRRWRRTLRAALRPKR